MGHPVTGRAGAAPGGLVTVAFANEGDFTSWHDGKCTELGIPFPGVNGATGEPDPAAQWTQAAAAPRVIDGYWTVTLTPEQIAADSTLKGLEVLTVKYPSEPGSPTDENGNPVSVIEVVPPELYYKEIPEGDWATDTEAVEAYLRRAWRGTTDTEAQG